MPSTSKQDALFESEVEATPKVSAPEAEPAVEPSGAADAPEAPAVSIEDAQAAFAAALAAEEPPAPRRLLVGDRVRDLREIPEGWQASRYQVVTRPNGTFDYAEIV
jgi:sugar/nucleoside kinase (ribokinase family)